ncbi:MAG: ATP-binding protein [Promethearchaeota archaeon]
MKGGHRIAVGLLVVLGIAAIDIVCEKLSYTIALVITSIISIGIFVVGWNTRNLNPGGFSLFLGLGFLWVGVLDLTSIFAQKLLFTFPDYWDEFQLVTRDGAAVTRGLTFLISTRYLNKAVNQRRAFVVFSLAVVGFLALCIALLVPTGLLASFSNAWVRHTTQSSILALLGAVLLAGYPRIKESRPKFARLLFFSCTLEIGAHLFMFLPEDLASISNFAYILLVSIASFTVYLAVIRNGLLDPLTGVFMELEREKEKLREAKLEAEAANRSKSEFLANMSHEIRTPMNAVIGFTEVIQDGLAGPVTQEQADFLERIHSSGIYLLEIINNILDLSKIEAGKMTLEAQEMPLRECVEETEVLLKDKVAEKGQSLRVEIGEVPEKIVADKVKLKRALINLLGNAWKFTPEGGEIGIRTRYEPDEVPEAGGSVVFEVWDTGVGIAPEDLGKLFKPFQQLNSQLQDKVPGTGLGLVLTKKIVELHGGSIEVESKVGLGTKFTFKIPARVNA